MAIINEYPVAEGLKEARWNASMDALEANWLTRIAATQAEYQEVRMSLGKPIADRNCHFGLFASR